MNFLDGTLQKNGDTYVVDLDGSVIFRYNKRKVLELDELF